MKRKKILNVILCLTLTVMLAASACLLTGCSLFKIRYADFNQSTLEIAVGEKYDLTQIIDSNTDNYTLSVSSTKIVSLSGSTITGVAEGKAIVTVKAGRNSSQLNVTVVEAEDDVLDIDISGELAQVYGKTSAVTFTPNVSGVSAKGTLKWYVNDTLEATSAATKPFEFTPNEQGKYVVRVKSSTQSVEKTIRVYKPANITVTCSGDLIQFETPYEPIKFTAIVGAVNGNPEAYTEWSVDGNVVQEGTELEFIYVPTAGVHTVTVRVNGESANINGEPSVRVECEGSVTPDGAPTVLYDNVYPHIYIQYEVAGNACVEISSPDGTVKEYSQNSSEYASYFDENGFDAREFITLFSETSSQKAYRIRVKSLGDGGVLKESDYSPTCILTMIPKAAEKYLNTRILDCDAYITSEKEFVAIFEYESIFRPKSSLSTSSKVSFDCYMAYKVSDLKKLFNDAFYIGATSGSYTDISYTYVSQNVLRVSYTVDTINVPTKQTKTAVNSYKYSKQLHATIPHINYDESKYRSSNYKFAIDKLENTKSVKFSDELYLTAQNNTRPIPTSGSPAEAIYSLARDVLRKIVTDDMTDKQKAHAIYDWIMWQVTYDSPATSNSITNGESYSAYYLEGVFGNGTTAIPVGLASSQSTVKYEPYAVCDGMSKAYSLMCNIEGIPCVRVAGTAGSSVSNAGGHAWNKVCLDGNWYIVDCTWGDGTAEIKFDGTAKAEYELGLHDWLFVTDAQAADTHFEPHDSGESSIVYAPRTAGQNSMVYSEMQYNGTNIDCLISRGEDQASRITEIVTEYMRVYEPMTTITVPGGPNGGVYSVDYQLLEIYFDCTVTLMDNQIYTEIEKAVKAVDPNADMKSFIYDNIAVLLVK